MRSDSFLRDLMQASGRPLMTQIHEIREKGGKQGSPL